MMCFSCLRYCKQVISHALRQAFLTMKHLIPDNGGGRETYNGNSSSSSDEVLTRILERRSNDCDVLGEKIVQKLVEGPWMDLTTRPLEEEKFPPKEKFLYVLRYLVAVASNEKVASASKRRRAFNSLAQLLLETDTQLRKKKERRLSTGISEDRITISEIVIPLNPAATSSSERPFISQANATIAEGSSTQNSRQAARKTSEERKQQSVVSDSQSPSQQQIKTRNSEQFIKALPPTGASELLLRLNSDTQSKFKKCHITEYVFFVVSVTVLTVRASSPLPRVITQLLPSNIRCTVTPAKRPATPPLYEAHSASLKIESRKRLEALRGYVKKLEDRVPSCPGKEYHAFWERFEAEHPKLPSKDIQYIQRKIRYHQIKQEIRRIQPVNLINPSNSGTKEAISGSR